jgi:hypothetical protein
VTHVSPHGAASNNVLFGLEGDQMRRLFVTASFTFGMVILALDCPAGQDKAKFTISEVMQQGHKGGLLKKVQEGKANDEDAKLLLDYYQALTLNKPPMGDEAAWKKQTEAMVAAAKLVVDGKKDEGIAALKKEINCMKCHKMFKN